MDYRKLMEVVCAQRPILYQLVIIHVILAILLLFSVLFVEQGPRENVILAIDAALLIVVFVLFVGVTRLCSSVE